VALLIAFFGFDGSWSIPPCGGASPCEFTSDGRELARADAVVFHATVLDRAPRMHKPPGQRWVAWSMESVVTIPALGVPAVMRCFDLTMSYQRSSDVWTPYISRQLLDELATPARPKTAAYPVARVQSNAYDRSGRNRYGAELMKHVKVASYGQLGPTTGRWAATAAGRLSGPAGRQAKLETIAAHKFTLAFENSIAPDYVTEKFFDPLVAGSVPVYLGAPNIADFAPGDHCYIDVADFAGPGSLGAYLDHLDRHDDEYDEYLRWKDGGPDQRFRSLVASTSPRPFCRLAELLAGSRHKPLPGAGTHAAP
jgi:hypothetical protein